jgi:hypothetical protein
MVRVSPSLLFFLEWIRRTPGKNTMQKLSMREVGGQAWKFKSLLSLLDHVLGEALKGTLGTVSLNGSFSFHIEN